jgi:outer membrane receptor for ferrienterochelin and colicins
MNQFKAPFGPVRAALLGTALAFGLSALFPGHARAVQDHPQGSISGVVTDAETGEPLFNATVTVPGTPLGAVSGLDGRFEIERVPAGVRGLDVTLIGYEKRSVRNIRVVPGGAASVRISLVRAVLPQETMVVTASKRRQRLEDAPNSVDVLSADAIRMRSVTRLDQALENTAGFGVIDGQIDLRGSTGFNWAAGSRVLMMVDGHPLINGDTGGINWDAIPVEEVEKVEIVKGAGSALYGSNAMAGMVNVITRDPSPIPETRARISWGFYDTPAYSTWKWTDRFMTARIGDGNWNPVHSLSFEEVDLSHGRKIGKVGLSLNVSRRRSSGYFENGDYSQWNAGGKVKINWSLRKSLSVSGSWTSNNHGEFIQWISQSKPLETMPEELGNRIHYEKIYLHSTYKNVVNSRLNYTLKANFYRTDWRNFFWDNHDKALTDRYGAEAQFDYLANFWKPQTITFGSEAVYHRARSLIYGNPQMRDAALYVEDELRFAGWGTLTAGARYDFHDLVDMFTDRQLSPRLGMVFHPGKGTSVRMSAGRGFRAPSIAEVFADITVSGVRVVPNLDLRRAEKANSFEIGINQTLVFSESTRFSGNPLRRALERLDLKLSADAAVFYSRYENMIDVDLNPDLMAFQFVNFGEAEIRGFELRLQGTAFRGHLSGNAGWTRLDPKDIRTGKVLNYRSKERLTTGAECRIGKLTFGLDYRYASRIEEVVNLFNSDERVPMHVMDGRVRLDLGRTELCVEAKNLRNYQYTLRQRYLEPVRNFTVTARTKW